MKEQLIFIASAPRSGSTWFGNLFNSHPDILYRHEPLARLPLLIGTQLLHKLKHSNGISEIERKKLLQLLYKAHPESDRPPFFRKSSSASLPSQIRFLFWAAAIKSRWFGTIYEKCFSPTSPGKILVIKETGWSVHLESIINGLQATAAILLVRHPCAIIASILRGIDNGLMRIPDEKTKKDWYGHHQSSPFLISTGYQEKDVLQMDILSFWALRLRVLFDIFLSFQAENPERAFFVIYEEIQNNPLTVVADLFERLDITLAQNVTSFIQESTGRKSASLKSLQKRGKRAYFGVHRQGDYDPWRWRTQLSIAETAQISSIVGADIIEKFWPTTEPQKRSE